MHNRTVVRFVAVIAVLLLGSAELAAKQAAPAPRAEAAGGAAAPAGAPARQQAEGKAADSANAPAPQVTVQRSAGGRKVFRIETGFVIEGRIQKPNAFYVLQRSQINYDWSRLSQDFAPRILESVRHSPF